MNFNQDDYSPYLLFDHSPEAIIVTDSNFHIIYANPIASNVFQLSSKELLGKDFSSLLSTIESSVFIEKFHNRFNSDPSTVLVDVTEGVKGNGKVFSTELFISRLNAKEGAYNIIFLRNLEIRKKYSDELHLVQVLTRDISNAATFHEALEITIKSVCRYFSWDYGEAWIVSEDKMNFIYEVGWFQNPSLKDFANKSSKIKFSINEGLPHDVSKGKLIWTSSVATYSGFKRANITSHAGLTTLVGVPIKIEQELLACILFFSIEEKEKDNSIISILNSLSNQLAVLLKKKRAEDELKEREYFIQQVAEISPNIISVYDIINKKSIYTNRELITNLGYTKKDLLKFGDKILDVLVHPDDIPKVIERDSKYAILKDDETLELEIRLKSKGGNFRWINTRSKILKRTEEGKPWLTVSSANDVTESVNDKIKLKEREKALKILNKTLEQKVKDRTQQLEKIALKLREREELLSLIINSIPAYISYIDKDYVYRFANDYYKNLDFINGDITGKHVKEAIIEKYYNKSLPSIQLAFEGKNSSFEVNVTLKDGSEKHVDVNYISDKSEDGEVRGVIVLAIDLTQRIEFENILNKQNSDLKKINKDLDTFVYIASHDLKAPISNILGLTKLMFDLLKGQNKLNDELDRVLDMIKKSVEQFNKTIKSLTDVSRIQRNYNEDLTKVDLGDVLHEVKMNLNKMIMETNTLIKESIESCPSITFSKIHIKTLFYHLISNSIQYRHPDKPLSIMVSCAETSEYYLLEFRDNGLGIKKENQEKIFHLFRRYNTRGQGSGVGLYIVRRIVEDNGGRIEVESEENKGSNFKVYIKK